MKHVKVAPKLEIHLSTQQSLSNYKAVEYWKEEGLDRVVLARETGAMEMREMKEKVDIEIEAFIHGAMCIAYSGRCTLKSYDRKGFQQRWLLSKLSLGL